MTTLAMNMASQPSQSLDFRLLVYSGGAPAISAYSGTALETETKQLKMRAMVNVETCSNVVSSVDIGLEVAESTPPTNSLNLLLSDSQVRFTRINITTRVFLPFPFPFCWIYSCPVRQPRIQSRALLSLPRSLEPDVLKLPWRALDSIL